MDFHYDGERFLRLVIAEGLTSDSITVLHATRQGNLWVATQKRLVAWHGVASGSSKPKVLLPDKEVLGIASSDAGHLLVSTTIRTFEGNEQKLLLIPGMPPAAGAAWISPDRSQELLATSGRLYRRGAMGDWESRQLPPTLAVEAVQAVAQDGRGRIWIRAGAGAAGVADTRELQSARRGPQREPARCSGAKGRALSRPDRPPTNHGIAWFNGDQRGLVDVKRGLTNEWATTVMVDHEGSLRVGSEGVHRLQGRLAWTSFTRRQGLPSDTVWAVLRDRAGTLWSATNSGVAQATEAGWVTLPMSKDRSFYAFAESTSGDRWIGGYSGHAGTNTLLLRPHGADSFRTVLLGSAVGRAPSTALPSVPMVRCTLRHLRMACTGSPPTAPITSQNRSCCRAVPPTNRSTSWRAIRQDICVCRQSADWRRRGASDGLREQEIETITPTDANSVWVSYWNLSAMTHVRITDAGDVPPVLSSTAIWSPIPQSKEIGNEEALFGRTDHWFSA